MELSQLFYRYNPWWEDIDETSKFKSRHSILRQIESHAESPSVVFITGLRRVGKTTLMKMLIHQFIKTKKYQPRQIGRASCRERV